MFVTPDQLLAHAVGDYLLQSDWMATEKVRRSIAAAVHAVTYTLPFLFLTRNPAALAVVAGTHFVIDRWRLARYVCWAKNFIAPRHILKSRFQGFPDYRDQTAFEALWRRRNLPWAECSATGYGPEKPPWMAVWLLIIADNTMHVICNAIALQVWP